MRRAPEETHGKMIERVYPEQPELELGRHRLLFLDGGLLGFDVEVAGRRMVLDLSVWPALVLSDGQSLLVDASFGPADPVRWTKFRCRPAAALEKQVAARCQGHGPDRILLTHLHFDHACGVLRKEGDRELLRFPDAQLLVERQEWEAAREDDRGGNLAERILRANGGREPGFVEDGSELAPGLRVEVVPGHTEGLCVLWVRDGGQAALLPSDLIPSRRFLTPREDHFVDLDPALALEGRMRLLDRAHAEDAYVCFYHDPKRLFGKLKPNAGPGYALR